MSKSKVIIVTGGSRGIGKAITKKMVGLGYKVVIIYQSNSSAAKELKVELKKENNADIMLFKMSVTDIDNVKKTFAEIAQNGMIVGLINNAGIIRDGLLMTMNEENWKDVIRTNLYGTLISTKHIIPYMKEQGGVIINMTSISGLRGEKGQTNYAATKSAICQLTKTAAMELMKYNINVYAVAPGFVATDMVDSVKSQIQKKNMKIIPAGRYATTNEIAELVASLFEFKGNYMSGNTYIIDGGLCNL